MSLKAALPELKSIRAYIGNKLGMQTMAVGPLKKPSEALLRRPLKEVSWGSIVDYRLLLCITLCERYCITFGID